MNKSDKILVDGLKKGDYSSFNELFYRYYSGLCAYVDSIVQDEATSEDLVQTLFYKLWANRYKLGIQKNIGQYLYRSAKNSALNYLKSELGKNNVCLNSNLIDDPCDEEEFLRKETFYRKLEECIEQLPERSKAVLLKSRFEGLKQKEIADLFNISVKTIKNHIWKSLRFLKSCVELEISI
nr:RNA polymerase sigma-70 factor [uncultured Draconibacterium sp.]